MLQYIPFTLVFWICAYYDFKMKKVPDVWLALLWLAFGIVGFDASAYQLAIVAFGAMFLFNVKKQIFGWGDILAAAPVVGVFSTFGSYAVGCLLIGLIACEVRRRWEKKAAPVLPFVFFGFVLALSIKLTIPTA